LQLLLQFQSQEKSKCQFPFAYAKSKEDHLMPGGMGWLKEFYPEDGGCRFLQYVCNKLPDYTASITKNIFRVTTIINSYLAELPENSQSWRLKDLCMNENFLSVLAPEFKDSCKPNQICGWGSCHFGLPTLQSIFRYLLNRPSHWV
jgi:hypothetical protein